MRRPHLSFALLALALVISPAASADPCTSDADCAEDEFCSFGSDGPFTTDPIEVPAPSEADADSEGDEASDSSDKEPASEERGEAEGICEPIPEPPASECEADSDCPQGQSCQEAGSMGFGCACEASDPDCEECANFDREELTFYACLPAPCVVDADCGEGLKCIEFVDDFCDEAPIIGIGAPEPMPDSPEGAPCREGEDCDEGGAESLPPMEECEPTVTYQCGPKWLAPCEVAADCGDGFSCVEEEVCSCASFGGDDQDGSEGFVPEADPVDSTDTEEDREEGSEDDDDSRDFPMPSIPGDPEEGSGADCSCEGTGVMMCESIEESCSTDDDCSVEGWVCFEDMGGAVSVSQVCEVNADGEEICEIIEGDDDTSEGICVPADFEDWSGALDGPGGMGENLAAEAGMADSDNASANPSAPSSGDLGAGDDGVESVNEDSGGGSGGCQSSETSPFGLAVALMLAMAWLARRRPQGDVLR